MNVLKKWTENCMANHLEDIKNYDVAKHGVEGWPYPLTKEFRKVGIYNYQAPKVNAK